MSSTPFATAPISGLLAVFPAVAASVSFTATTPRSMSFTKVIRSWSRVPATTITTNPIPMATHQKVTSSLANPGMLASPLHGLSDAVQVLGHRACDALGDGQIPQRERVVVGPRQPLDRHLRLQSDPPRHLEERRHQRYHPGDHDGCDREPEKPSEQV